LLRFEPARFLRCLVDASIRNPFLMVVRLAEE